MIDKFNDEQQKSFALSVLEIYKNANRRLFIVLLVALFMWFIKILLSVYLNKIGIGIYLLPLKNKSIKFGLILIIS